MYVLCMSVFLHVCMYVICNAIAHLPFGFCLGSSSVQFRGDYRQSNV